MKLLLEDIARNTLVDWPRLAVIAQCLSRTSGLEGDVAEVGVYKGGTALWIDAVSNKYAYFFDTFEGMPESLPVDIHKRGDFGDTSIEKVKALFTRYNLPRAFEIHKGIFPEETGRIIEREKFSFVHIDVDIYSSVKNCLEFFDSRMVPGGIILLDDYNEPNCPGAKLAADEWARENGQFIFETVQSQAMVKF